MGGFKCTLERLFEKSFRTSLGNKKLRHDFDLFWSGFAFFDLTEKDRRENIEEKFNLAFFLCLRGHFVGFGVLRPSLFKSALI